MTVTFTMEHAMEYARPAIATVLFVVALAGGASLEAREPGVALTFESITGDPGGAQRDARVARLVALRVEAGESPTPFLPTGRFRAVFEGFIDVEFFDDYTFYLEGHGRARLEIDGEVVLAGEGDLAEIAPRTVELDEGARPFTLRFESDDDGSGALRLEWSSFDFLRGPVQPSVLEHDDDAEVLRRAGMLRRGRSLLAERRCLSCHVPAAEFEPAMPELAARAPHLAGIGRRLRAAWIAGWILAPHAERREATMPAVLSGTAAERAGQAANIAAFLDGSGAGESASEDRLPGGDPSRGGELFAKIGCIACHRFEGDGEEIAGERPRVSLDHVAARWRPRALARFLEDPANYWPASRMPALGLTAEDAGHLAAWLLEKTRERPASSGEVEGDAERGRAALESSGCLACHDAGKDGGSGEAGDAALSNRLVFPALVEVLASDLRAGCLASEATARGAAPDFTFDAAEIAALRAFLRDGLHSLARRVAAEYAERTIDRLRCLSCHRRDGKVDGWTALEGESVAAGTVSEAPPAVLAPSGVSGASGEGTLVQERPLLTWTGEKLRTPWLSRFLADPFAHATRPWLGARMPRFVLDAHLLADGLAAQHGEAVDAGDPERSGAPVDPAVGAKLLVVDGGLACVTCHDLAGVPATAAFEARGPDLVLTPRRLRKDFYLRWMLDPQSIWPGTKMPQFASEGVSPIADVYEGDGRRQFEAIWEYLVEASRERAAAAEDASGGRESGGRDED